MEPRPAAENLAWLSTGTAGRALLIRNWASEPEKFSFFAPDFALSSSTPWLIGQELASVPQLETHKPPAVLHRAEPSSADFHLLMEDILNRIRRHEFEKVVPVVCEESQLQRAPSAADFAATWRQAPERMWSYGFAHAGEGMAGVTPELLFSRKEARLQTMALAGTGPVDGPNLMDDKKERREHQLVVDHIAAELKPFGRVQVGDTCERTYGVLKHLFTPIEVSLSADPDFMQLVVRLHPTAALGGWPRRPAIEWLQQQKFHVARRRFGAPFGWVDRESQAAECVVAIRNVQWIGAHAQVFTGCGVVEGSQVRREWDELALKRKSTLQRLGWT